VVDPAPVTQPQNRGGGPPEYLPNVYAPSGPANGNKKEETPAKPDTLGEAVYPPIPSTIPTLGFAGPSGVMPRSGSNDEYDTVEDRWRIGIPEWDRYGLGSPKVFDYPYKLGQLLDPYNQNVLKGDYPILGQHTFLELTGTSSTFFSGQTLPTATVPFESTARPFTTNFFNRDGQFAFQQNTFLSIDLFQGDGAFKPVDWRVQLTPVVNVNTLSVQELAVVSPNVEKGLIRERSWVTLQEAFAEYKIADIGNQYDFMSVRAGSAPFTSDFRGFIYSATDPQVRFFGTADGNSIQYNLAYFRTLNKDINSELNTFNVRDQNLVIANLYKQDFLFPGYTGELSFHYNNDGPSLFYDNNGFIARPDPLGIAQPHRVEAYYLGMAGDGHIGPINVTNAFYWVLGRDSMNPIAALPQTINAQMAALELSYDRDWVRFRLSGFYQSGDGNPNNGHATGFDGIDDQTNFGGEFSFWRTFRIPILGVGLTNDQSLYTDLRSDRVDGQSNFVNPGLWLVGGGIDFDITPRLRFVSDANWLWFDKTASLEKVLNQANIDRFIGLDLSGGFEWRPRLNNNAIFTFGVGSLIPGIGFSEIYGNHGPRSPTLFSAVTRMILQF
jgi:hypothetical protein